MSRALRIPINAGADRLSNHSSIADQLTAFVQSGNTYSGPIPKTEGAFRLQFSGRGAHIASSDKVTLVSCVIQFPEDGGTLNVSAGTTLRGKVTIGSKSFITIGARTFFRRACWLIALEGANIEIGSGCLFSDATLRTCDMHSIMDASTGERLNASRSIAIGNQVWLAERSYVSKGVSIGDGSVVAANAVVSRSVPSNSIVAGNPAVVVKSGITWDRKRYPIDPLPATPVPIE